MNRALARSTSVCGCSAAGFFPYGAHGNRSPERGIVVEICLFCVGLFLYFSLLPGFL